MANNTGDAIFRCDTCDACFRSERDYDAHMGSKKHTKQAQIKHNNKCAIYVKATGMDLRQYGDEQKLHTFLTQYGKIKHSYKDVWKGSWTVVVYEEEESVQNVLAAPKEKFVLGDGKEISVTLKKTKEELKALTKDPNAQTKPHYEFNLQELLKDCFSIEEQIDTLVKEIQGESNSDEVLMKRRAVCEELTDILTAYLPHTTLELFGSAASGLGAKGSDLDISVFLNLDKYDENAQPWVSQKEFPYINEAGITTADLQNRETRTLNIPGLKEFVNASRDNAIILLCRLISNQSSGFTSISTRIGARVPVIKGYHGGVYIHCDISCENRLAVRNTRLLKFYQELDPRVEPLLCTMRFLGSSMGFSGTIVGHSPKMYHYCLYMLVIYYLQNTQPPILPTVAELAALADASERITVDSYDTSYTSDTSRVKQPTNYSSLAKLLCDFFIFYADFDFSYYVICPRIGKVIPVLEIDRYCEFKEGTDFKPKVVHIQDPFVLDQNIAGNMNKQKLDHMVAEFRKCRMLVTQPGFGEVTVAGDWGLTALARKVNLKTDCDKTNQPRSKEKELRGKTLPDGRASFYFDIPMQSNIPNRPYMSWQPLSQRINLIALKQWWTYRVVHGFLSLLEGPYQCNVVTEAKNIGNLSAEYEGLEKQRQCVRKLKGKSRVESTEVDDPPIKRVKLETDSEAATAHNDEVTKQNNGTSDEGKAVPQHNYGVFYCPLQRDAVKASYDVNMQSLFSSEHYDKKQLLLSVGCNIYSRLDDLFYARNRIRAKLVEEEGYKHVLDDTDEFCNFESQVTNVALSDVAMTRPADYNVIEVEPVMEFHSHISLINNKGESLTLEIEMEDDTKLKEGEKAKKGGFSDRFVTSLRSMLMKLVKNFPT